MASTPSVISDASSNSSTSGDAAPSTITAAADVVICANCGIESGAAAIGPSIPGMAASAPVLRMQRCSRCKVTRYCSRECQAGHWPTHSPVCVAAPVVAKKSLSESKASMVASSSRLIGPRRVPTSDEHGKLIKEGLVALQCMTSMMTRSSTAASTSPSTKPSVPPAVALGERAHTRLVDATKLGVSHDIVIRLAQRIAQCYIHAGRVDDGIKWLTTAAATPSIDPWLAHTLQIHLAATYLHHVDIRKRAATLVRDAVDGMNRLVDQHTTMMVSQDEYGSESPLLTVAYGMTILAECISIATPLAAVEMCRTIHTRCRLALAMDGASSTDTTIFGMMNHNAIVRQCDTILSLSLQRQGRWAEATSLANERVTTAMQQRTTSMTTIKANPNDNDARTTFVTQSWRALRYQYDLCDVLLKHVLYMMTHGETLTVDTSRESIIGRVRAILSNECQSIMDALPTSSDDPHERSRRAIATVRLADLYATLSTAAGDLAAATSHRRTIVDDSKLVAIIDNGHGDDAHTARAAITAMCEALGNLYLREIDAEAAAAEATAENKSGSERATTLAGRYLLQSLSRLERDLGTTSLRLVTILTSLGQYSTVTFDIDGALRYHQRAVAIAEQHEGPAAAITKEARAELTKVMTLRKHLGLS